MRYIYVSGKKGKNTTLDRKGLRPYSSCWIWGLEFGGVKNWFPALRGSSEQFPSNASLGEMWCQEEKWLGFVRSRWARRKMNISVTGGKERRETVSVLMVKQKPGSECSFCFSHLFQRKLNVWKTLWHRCWIKAAIRCLNLGLKRYICTPRFVPHCGTFETQGDGAAGVWAAEFELMH